MPKAYVEYKDDLQGHMAFTVEALDIREMPPTMGLKATFFRQGQRKADIDNLLKTVSDAATGIFWADDSQVREQYGRVVYGSEDPRVEIEVYLLRGD